MTALAKKSAPQQWLCRECEAMLRQQQPNLHKSGLSAFFEFKCHEAKVQFRWGR